jgi:hypothetical protein
MNYVHRFDHYKVSDLILEHNHILHLPQTFHLMVFVDAFSERQILKKNRGGALCTGADGPRAGPDGPRPGAQLGLLCLTAGRSARTQRRRKSPAAPGSRSREGPRRGGEILGGV